MGFLFFNTILKPLIGNYEMKVLNEKKKILKERGDLQRKALAPPNQTIYSFFGYDVPYPNNDFHQKEFEEDLTLFITKEIVLLSFVEVPFFRKLFLKQNLHLNFPSRQTLVNEILPRITNKTKEMYTFSTLESCNSCTMNFDLWMSKAKMNTFVYIVHVLNEKWEPCHVTIGFFETTNTYGNAIVGS
jgi:hypothetical protein